MHEREKLLERYDDAAFALMMDECAENEGAAFLAEFQAAAQAGELPELPENIDRACRDTIKREYAGRERKVRFKQFRRAAAKAAVAVFAVIGILGTLVMSVEAWRVPLLSYILERYEFATELDFTKTPNQVQSEANQDDPLIPILPDGYWEVYYESNDGLVSSMYENKDAEWIVFDMSRAEGQYGFSTENASVEYCTLAGYEAIYVTKDSHRQMIWIDTDSAIVFTFSASSMDTNDFMSYCNIIAEHYRN